MNDYYLGLQTEKIVNRYKIYLVYPQGGVNEID